jgi:hypothetical protein
MPAALTISIPMGLSDVCATWFRNNCLLDAMDAIYKEAKLSS